MWIGAHLHGGEYERWRPKPYSHTCAVREIREAIAAGASDAAAAPFMDGKLPAHTEANNVHAGPYGIVQKRAQYLQLLSLDSMHIMIVKELESQLAIVLKRIARTSELKKIGSACRVVSTSDIYVIYFSS